MPDTICGRSEKGALQAGGDGSMERGFFCTIRRDKAIHEPIVRIIKYTELQEKWISLVHILCGHDTSVLSRAPNRPP